MTGGDLYANWAKVYDYFFGDRTAEIEFWAGLAEPHGRHVLDVMCGTAEVGLALPETPPWEAMPEMPEAPALSPHAGATPSPWEAMRMGITRQSVIKMWISQKIEEKTA